MNAILLALLLVQAPVEKPLETAKDAPVIVPFAPGLEVRELPVQLTNLNNLEYAPDGRLFAAGYDGRLHLLRDTDGDGLEDQVTTFYETKSDDYPLGMVVKDGDLIVLRRHAAIRHHDSNGDGVPDTESVAATGWRDPEVDKNALMTHRRVDDALGLAIGPDGTTYVTMGAANYSKGYLTKDGEAHLDLKQRRGCLLAIPPGGGEPKIVSTGVRFIVCLQFNKAGDLFGADQEGATWLPNGNPFDELLHLQPGRHYGFPPRHPKYLPDVIDEPSLVDFGPQHQSTCGFRFNEPREGRGRFGPALWEGDAFVVAMSRGKLYRVELAKTAAGYVARHRQFASINMLPIDVTISPKGELVICCHSGAPDWGSGPKGAGKIYKISWKDQAAPQPLFAWPAGPGETGIAFDRPLPQDARRDLLRNVSLESGPFVTAGDRFERFRPGYQVVKDQMASPRWSHPILSSVVSADGRSILLRTTPRESAVGYAVSLPGTAELNFELTGVEAVWTASTGDARWQGWLPHPDLAAARALTKGSAEHDRLWSLLAQPGRLTLRGQLDLKRMLQPAIQANAKLDWEYPAEKVTVEFQGSDVRGGKIDVTTSDAWVPLEVSIATGKDARLDVSWHTAEDLRPRPLELKRTKVPWARPASLTPLEARPAPEIEGGRWAEGKAIFFGERAACGKCHTIRGEGGKIGPDLSNVIFRDYASVLNDIVRPSAAINPDHLAYSVRLKNGDILAGVIVQALPDALLFGTTTGEQVRVERTKIEAMEPSTISLMPEKLLEGLTKEQIRDLMTFLLKPQ